MRDSTERVENRQVFLRDGIIAKELAQVERRLGIVCDEAGPGLEKVSSYTLKGSGKRIRPALFLLSAFRPGAAFEPMIDVAVAFELVHTASLLHDDVIDQAATRRGRAAAQVRWGNRISILSGNYLLTRALQLLLAVETQPLLGDVVDLVRKMTEGEVEQAFAEPGFSGLEERYFEWIGKKSASFFSVCCRSGYRFRGDCKEEEEKWAAFGYNLGMAFQLVDDLLDYTATGELTGKPAYGDLNNRVLTLPLIWTIQRDKEKGSLQNLLDEEKNSGCSLADLANAVLDSDGLEYTYQKADKYIACALDILAGLKRLDPRVRSELEGLTRGVLARAR